MKIGAAYIRVSTDDQMELSPDSQLKQIKEYANAHNILLSPDYIFREDEGRSGRNAAKRPEFQRMIGLAKAKPKPFDIILLWKFSRFARNREDSVVYKSMLRKQCKIDVVSVSENIGDDKMSVLIEAIIEAMDEYYSINLAGEVLRGMREKAERGGLVGSPAYGYRVESGLLVPEPEQAEIVRLIFQKFQEGMGYFTIANMLNGMGLRTRSGKPFQNRVVEYILRNPVYIGKTRWSPNGHIDRDFEKEGVILTDGKHEPLITPEQFETAQGRVAEIQHNRKRYQREPKQGGCMLQSLVRCSNCGSTLVRTGAGMQCNAYAHGSCRVSHYISLGRVNRAVLEQIDQDFTKGIFNLTVRKSESETSPAKVAAQQLERAHDKYERAKEAYEAGVYSLQEYKESRSRIQEEIERLKKLCAVTPPLSQDSLRKAFLKKSRNTLNALRNPELSDEEKNGLLRSFVDHIVYDRTKDKITVFYYL